MSMTPKYNYMMQSITGEPLMAAQLKDLAERVCKTCKVSVHRIAWGTHPGYCANCIAEGKDTIKEGKHAGKKSPGSEDRKSSGPPTS